MKKSSEKEVTIIVTVLPPKKGVRKMLVSAARDGEMPLVLSGPFAERHHLLDQAYATCLKREPQIVTHQAPKIGKSKSITGNVEPDEDAAPSDQLVGNTEEELPAIEGDEETPAAMGDTALEAAGDEAKFEAQLKALRDTDEVGQVIAVSGSDDGQTHGSAPTGSDPTDEGIEDGSPIEALGDDNAAMEVGNGEQD